MSMIQSLVIQPNVYYTLEETAQLLRVSPHSVLQLLNSGQTRGIQIEKQWRILGMALLNMSFYKEETLNQHLSDWLAASTPSLEDIWDNEEDAVYDNL